MILDAQYGPHSLSEPKPSSIEDTYNTGEKAFAMPERERDLSSVVAALIAEIDEEMRDWRDFPVEGVLARAKDALSRLVAERAEHQRDVDDYENQLAVEFTQLAEALAAKEDALIAQEHAEVLRDIAVRAKERAEVRAVEAEVECAKALVENARLTAALADARECGRSNQK